MLEGGALFRSRGVMLVYMLGDSSNFWLKKKFFSKHDLKGNGGIQSLKKSQNPE